MKLVPQHGHRPPYSNYDTTVGAMMGQGYSGSQTKTSTGAQGTIKSGTVGGGYTLMVALQRTDTQADGTAVRIDDNQTKYLNNSISKGAKARLHFTNDWNTLVNVQVSGQFRAY
ncbi:hypothetical protein [Micropruina sp.]|uniref:hypothetical protein n=1 Tax=Micropruina sp. TaxID=2737536 RepID=UPI0039E34035